jgi:mRNA interferase MazF
MVIDQIKTHFKDFTNWINTKVIVNSKKTVPPFREREIWWCSIGINVGMEIDGKGVGFARPVLIIKKFNKFQFWAIPITSKDKSNNPFYFPINYDNKTYYACLVHLRSFDSKRLRYNTGHKVSSLVFDKLKEQLKLFLQ